MTLPSALYQLSDLCVLQFDGDDAAQFLHSQITQDVLNLSSDRAALGAYCNAKGRVFSTLIFWQSEAEHSPIRAIVKADIADSLIKRLRMFILRSKVTIKVTPLKVYGVTADARADLVPATANCNPWTLQQNQDHTWIRCPEQAPERWWLCSDAELPEAQPDSAAWQCADLQAGLPWVGERIQELFIPQTLNLDLIDAVNFRKGCYPGQEVVARSHYRGTIKRRMVYAHSGKQENMAAETAAQPITQDWAGMDVYMPHEPERPCGRIINAVFFAQQLHVLMEIQLSDTEQGPFVAGSAQGPHLHLGALPYEIQAQAR